MPINTKKKSVKKSVSKSRVEPAEQRIVVSGDEEIFSVPVVSSVVKKRTRVKKPQIPKVTNEPILISVSIDGGASSKVARYSGLFFMIVGACFASYSLSGLYVETIELSTSTHFPYPATRQIAQITTALQPTEGTVSSSEPQQNQPAVSSETNVTAPPPTGQEPLATTTRSTEVAPIPVNDETNVTLEPHAELSYGSDTVVGIRKVFVKVERAGAVELLAVQRTSLTEKYLGNAMRVGVDMWLVNFDSTQMPNGEYKIFARITNTYGSYTTVRSPVTIFNAPPLKKPLASSSPEAVEVAEIKTSITSIVGELQQQEPARNLTKEIHDIVTPTQKLPPDTTTTVSKTEDAVIADADVVEKSNPFLSNFELEFKVALELYTVAMRARDINGMERMKARILELERQSLDRVSTDLITDPDNSGEMIQKVRVRISEIMRTELERTEKQERVILDRVGEKISRDSDRDGVTDYDEQAIYMTDPLIADTDKDGFTDGAEILSGFNPVDEEREVTMAFEDPRTTGVTRDDILSIDSLMTVQDAVPATAATATPPSKILFAGKALPNSFVSIYIYSTPIIVTVKTTDDGSWSYSFDKEMENGQHHMYVGITDNAGKLIAKSKPFPFVKTANAYAGGTISEQVTQIPDATPQLFSRNALILTIALVVVMVGLVLVLLGAYLAHRQRFSPEKLQSVAV